MATVDLLSRIAAEDEDDYMHQQEGHKYHNDWDDGYGGHKSSKKKSKKNLNGYHTVNINQDEDDDDDNGNVKRSRNPFDEVNDNFKNEKDPEQYIGCYKHIKSNIKLINNNIDSISKLRDKFNLSDSQKQYQSIMNELDEIMMRNSILTRKIKQNLNEEKSKNDKLKSSGDHESSSILQWRINQLNSCVREFKNCASLFEWELSKTQNALKEKEKRKLREFDEKHELNEEKIDYMVDNPDQVSSFLQKKFEGFSASDMLLDELEKLEDRHQGMIKIEQSIKELHALWAELAVLVTEQQEQLDRIENNVQETADYVKKGAKNLKKAEKKQKCSRKLGCCAVSSLLVIVVILVVFFGGWIKF